MPADNKDFDRIAAVRWAQHMLNNGDSIAVLDTETTSLKGEVVEIGVVDIRGATLFHSLIRPTVFISDNATEIHGLRDEDVANAPTAIEVLLPLLQAIGERRVIIYNARFDIETLHRSFKARGFPLWLAMLHDDEEEDHFSTRFINGNSLYCAMNKYARFVGEWNEKRANYRWQKLPGAGHRALEDARATLELIKMMAEG